MTLNSHHPVMPEKQVPLMNPTEGRRPAQHPVHNPQKMPAKWSLSLNSAIHPLTSLPRLRAVTLIPILLPPGRFALFCYLLEPLLPALD